MHGARQCVQVRLGVDEDMLTSALQEMPGSLGATMHMGGVMFDPLQAATAMVRWRLYLEVRVMRHEARGMHDDPPAAMSLRQLLQEDIAVFIVKEHLLSRHAA